MSGKHDKNKKGPKTTFYGAARTIVRQHGVLSLWRGFNLHLVRDVVGGGVYFGVYESVKQALGSYYGDEMKNTPWAIPLAGAICGISSWVVVSSFTAQITTSSSREDSLFKGSSTNACKQTYPMDTMKTRAQNTLLSTNSKKAPSIPEIVSEATKAAAKTASKQGRWRGIEMVIVRSAVQNMIQMTAFEQVKVLIDNAKFADGSTGLPDVERTKGRDRKII